MRLNRKQKRLRRTQFAISAKEDKQILKSLITDEKGNYIYK